MKCHYVTPTLFLGDPPALGRVVRVNTVSDAVSLILSGGIAVLPVDAWELADQILAVLGLTEDERWRQISFVGTRDFSQVTLPPHLARRASRGSRPLDDPLLGLPPP